MTTKYAMDIYAKVRNAIEALSLGGTRLPSPEVVAATAVIIDEIHMQGQQTPSGSGDCMQQANALLSNWKCTAEDVTGFRLNTYTKKYELRVKGRYAQMPPDWDCETCCAVAQFIAEQRKEQWIAFGK